MISTQPFMSNLFSNYEMEPTERLSKKLHVFGIVCSPSFWCSFQTKTINFNEGEGSEIRIFKTSPEKFMSQDIA